VCIVGRYQSTGRDAEAHKRAAIAHGTTLDAYEIHALLGSGDMVAYRGFDLKPHRSVAVKVPPTTLAPTLLLSLAFARRPG
jgi:hypothetical protein